MNVKDKLMNDFSEKKEDIIDGIKDRLSGDCCDHEDCDNTKDRLDEECCDHDDCDGFQLDDRVVEKVKEIIKMNKGKGSILDRVLGKVISRKLLVFATATVLLAQYGLDPDTWGLIAIVYIGGQSVIDAAKTWRHGR
tara:strand:- start:95 stop:505 length:411 start_codon:yes stop_codon:yes gene_type:complete